MKKNVRTYLQGDYEKYTIHNNAETLASNVHARSSIPYLYNQLEETYARLHYELNEVCPDQKRIERLHNIISNIKHTIAGKQR